MANGFANLLNSLNTLFSQLFTKLIIAIIIILIGFIIGKLVSRVVYKILHEFELNKSLKKARIRISLEEIISQFLAYFIYFAAIIWALNELGITTTVLNMIAAALLILIIISTLLAIKDFIPNFFACLFIRQRRILKIGSNVEIDKIHGKIKKIGLIETKILTKNGDIIYIPNSILTKKIIIRKKH
jgi:small conductance mechanosensitive channel